jgi:hypothetical protein
MTSIGAVIRGNLGHCRACPSTVLWVRMPTGSLMPVDPTPDDEGTVAAMRDGRGVWVGHVLTKDERPMPYEKRFMTHFATCDAVAARKSAIADGSVIDLRAVARQRGRR